MLGGSNLVIFQVLRYSWVSIVNTIFGLSVIWCLMYVDVGPFTANAAGYATGLLLSYFLNSTWTFRDHNAGRPIGRYLLTFAIAYTMNLLVLNYGLQVMNQPAYAIQLVAMTTYSVTFFILCRYIVFPSSDFDRV